MKITQDFINNLWFSGGWELETINEQTFSTLSNPVFCKLFWMQYWQEVLLPAFKQQTHITYIHDADLTAKVIIDNNNGNLLSAPPSFVNVYYYGTYFKNDIREPLFISTNPTFAIVFIVIFIIIAINVIAFFIKTKYQNVIEVF